MPNYHSEPQTTVELRFHKFYRLITTAYISHITTMLPYVTSHLSISFVIFDSFSSVGQTSLNVIDRILNIKLYAGNHLPLGQGRLKAF